VHAGVGYVADLIARIVDGIKGVMPLVLGLAGCEGPKVEASNPPPPAAVVVEKPKPEPKEPEHPKQLGKFDITFYYVIGEDEIRAKLPKRAANDETLASIAPSADIVTLYEPTKCMPIASVSSEFASELQMQGTGKLHDGRLLNIWGGCGCARKPCFKVTETQWGTSGSGRPLQPFRTVAVDRRLIKLGSLLYIPLLEGRTMPGRAPWGGYIHDGCVVADDTGGHINGNQLDLFVGRKGWFLPVSASRGDHAWARHVPVYDGSKICERKGKRIGRKAASI